MSYRKPPSKSQSCTCQYNTAQDSRYSTSRVNVDLDGLFVCPHCSLIKNEHSFMVGDKKNDRLIRKIYIRTHLKHTNHAKSYTFNIFFNL